MSRAPESGRTWALATLAALPLALGALIVLETAAVPAGAWSDHPLVLVPLLALLSHHAGWLLATPALAVVALGLLHALRIPRGGTLAADGAASPRRRALLLAAAIAACALATMHAHRTLVRYEPMRKYPVFLVAQAVLFAYLAWSALVAFGVLRPSVVARWGPAVVGLTGFGVAHAANVLLFNDFYASLHLFALEVSLLLLATGLAHVLARLSERPRRVALASAAVVGALVGAGALAAAAGAARSARPLLVHHTLLGQAEVLFHAPSEWLPEWLRDVEERPVRAGLVTDFDELSGLPRLPEDFRLEDYNVLLVTAECLRWDQTSLASPELGTTPSLERLVARGAWSFAGARAPASRTFESIGSLLTMLPPSAVQVRPDESSWYGRLLPENLVVPEILGASGWKTFWVTHDLAHSFSRKMPGFEQGFERVQFLPLTEPGHLAGHDARIVDAALEEVRRADEAGGRFFGWVFLVAGHSDVRTNDYPRLREDWPGRTKLERYRQALHASDEQVGRLVASLESSGLLDRTIVLVMGDHGEAFGEHGTTLHGGTLYEEVTHVPLVAWIPGVPGRVVGANASLTHVFPWLLLRGPEGARAATQARVTNVLAPLLRDTDGSVLMELFLQERVYASLVHGDEKLLVDFRVDVPWLFDLAEDPGETRSVFGEDPERDRAHLERFEAYWRIRGIVGRREL